MSILISCCDSGSARAVVLGNRERWVELFRATCLPSCNSDLPLRVILGATTLANDAGFKVKFGGDFEEVVAGTRIVVSSAGVTSAKSGVSQRIVNYDS